jgi:single-strand DNA-binding protein
LSNQRRSRFGSGVDGITKQESMEDTTMASTKTKKTAEPQATEAKPEQTTLTGRLTADPELRRTKNDKPVTTIRIAVNTPDADPTFHSVVVWGRQAEVVCTFLKKGRLVEVTGRPQERTYTAADGNERSVTEIIAWRVQFVRRETATAPVNQPELVA